MLDSAMTLPISAPEAQGIDAAVINAFVDAIEREVEGMHSFILLRHGKQVAAGWWAPYSPEIPHMLFSLSKSFTSTAIGILVAEERLSIDDYVLSFFGEEAPASPSDNLKAMQVRHLLTMSTGHAEETLDAMTRAQTGLTWAQAFLSVAVEYEPGTHFQYNSGASYMLSAIAQKISGERLINYLQPRLFEPLGIQNPVWEISPQGIDTGGWGLSMTTSDLAKFGQLYLQKGEWQGKQLLSKEWVTDATSCQIENNGDSQNDWTQGYGYQFRMCRHNTYRGDGAFGQLCVVMPEQDAVLVATGGLLNMQAQLNLIWNYILPVCGAATLPENVAAQQALVERLASLRLKPIAGQSTSPIAVQVSGKSYWMDRNEAGIDWVKFDFGEKSAKITFTFNQGRQEIACGYGEWLTGASALAPHPSILVSLSARQLSQEKIIASGGWTQRETFVAKIWWIETPYARTLGCSFDGDQVTIESDLNVAFGPTNEPTLIGRLK